MLHQLRPLQHLRGMSMVELLCVMLTIAILAAIYLGAISKAFVRVKHFLGS